MFPDRESAATFSNQLHDHNPGITEEGLFWTLLIAPESASWQSRAARMCAQDLFLPDMKTFENAVARGPMMPSTVSFDVDWRAASGRPELLRDEENRFVLRFRSAVSSVQWRATQPGVSFESVETNVPQETLFAAVGLERNGRFLG